MLVEQLKSKIHRAMITRGDVQYEGSIEIPADLMAAVDLWPGKSSRGVRHVREPSGNICSPGACRHGEHHHERRCGPFNQDGRTGGHYEFCLVGQAHHPQENRLQRA